MTINLISREFIPNPNPSAHASTVLTALNGDLLCAFFSGSREGNNDVQIYLARRHNGIWGDVRPVSFEENKTHWNPVLFRISPTCIALYYKFGVLPLCNWQTKVTYSYDEGLTWTQPQELVPGDTSGGRGPVKDKAVYLSNGTLLAPASTEIEHWRPFVDLSFDQGCTWEKHLIPVDESCEIELIQPSAWEMPDGHVHVFMRSQQGLIYRSDSEDFGLTWCTAYPTELPNNNSGLDLVLAADKHIYLVCNPIPTRKVRTPLSLLCGDSNGQNFVKLLDLETQPGEYSYPAIIADGNDLHITYTYQRKQIIYCHLRVTE